MKNAYLNINKEQTRSIRQVYQDHNEDLKLMIDKGISPNTYTRHFTSRNHLERYIQDAYKKKDYPLRDIDHGFIVKYETYLRTKRNCCNNTTVKYLKNVGKIIRFFGIDPRQSQSPKKVFIIGVYASVVHIKWIHPMGRTLVNALAVASIS